MLRFSTFQKEPVSKQTREQIKSLPGTSIPVVQENYQQAGMYYRQKFPYRSILCNRWTCHPFYQNLVANDGITTDPSRLRSCPQSYRDMGYIDYNMWWIGNNQNGVLRLCSPKLRGKDGELSEKTMEDDSPSYMLYRTKKNKKIGKANGGIFPRSINRSNASSNTQQFSDMDVPQRKSVFNNPYKLNNWRSYPTNKYFDV